MNIPYIRVKQRGEIFFVVKLQARYLKEHINFHFRDPYLSFQSTDYAEKTSDYLKKLQNKGLNLKSTQEGVQRRLQIGRINEIKEFISSNANNFFPNSFLLSVDATKIKGFEDDYLIYEAKETGYFDFPRNTEFTVIDGQHRLAGLFLSDERIIEDFELVAILLFNISLSTAAKLFSDINGKQKPVNRSLIYDLYEEIKTLDLDKIKEFHTIAQKFYTDEKSPLFRQIKMLGVGKGAISQAFFIDYTIDAIRKTNLDMADIQSIYNQLFYYFRAFQNIFPQDWPVLRHFKDYDELDQYSDQVLKQKKSQLVKTNGFGAIMRLFPDVYEVAKKDHLLYKEIISRLSGKISWVPEPTNPQGTGKQFQDYLYYKMKRELDL